MQSLYGKFDPIQRCNVSYISRSFWQCAFTSLDRAQDNSTMRKEGAGRAGGGGGVSGGDAEKETMARGHRRCKTILKNRRR